MRLVIAGGQPSSRAAISMLVKTRLEIEDVSEARNFDELMKLVERAEPDLILLDSELPGANLNKIIGTIRGLDRDLSVIVLNERPEMEGAVMAAGADVFIYKGNHPKQLLIAIEAVRMEKGHLNQP